MSLDRVACQEQCQVRRYGNEAARILNEELTQHCPQVIPQVMPTYIDRLSTWRREQAPSPKLSTRNPMRDQWRLVRLERAVEFLGGIGVSTLPKIESLHDDVDVLTVHWRDLHTRFDRLAVELAWCNFNGEEVRHTPD